MAPALVSPPAGHQGPIIPEIEPQGQFATEPAAVRLASPDDLEARSSSQRETHWGGYQVHRTETCDADHPDLITQVMTTPATPPARVMGPAIQQDLAARDLRPGTHVLDSGSVEAAFLVTAQTPHQIDVVGPPFGSYRRQWQAGPGYDLQAFVIDWAAQQARCPQGHSSVHWRPGHDGSGDPVIRIRFDGATCRACPTRKACTSAQAAPRQLTVRPQVHHAALQAARQRQETPPFKAQDALRAGMESRLSQGSRRVDLRQSRDLGFARTHLQPLLTATAMNRVRVMAWLWGEPLGERRRQPGHLAQLAS
jgi:Transposase DDE domain